MGLIPDDRSLITDATWVLVAKAQVPAETLRRNFPNQVKIGPVEQIAELINVALRGIEVSALPVVPRQLPFYGGRSYFELDRNSPYFAASGTIGGNCDPRHRRYPWVGNRVLGDPRIGMSNDPLAEPTAIEATRIRPRPAGVGNDRGGAAEAPFGEHELLAVPKIGTNPLVAAAAPVLAAVLRVASDLSRNPDVDQLRRAIVAAMRRFEVDALATDLDTRSLRAARYALCTTIDDMILSTPWGRTSSWVQQSMTSIFHNEVTGGERFTRFWSRCKKTWATMSRWSS